nr:glycerophosphodiester phosphodiesterase family protein [uncultured Sulfurimonas sp.]
MSFLELFKRPCLIGAHRGSSALYPENTLIALKQSLNHCDFIEIDVQLTQDNVAIIFHDETLERTTNVQEVYKNRASYKVSDFSYDELKKLDYGSWFYCDGKKYQPLLTLLDALEFAKDNNIFLNIEIKDIYNYFDDDIVVSTILHEITDSLTQDLVLISSFRHQYLKLFKELISEIPTAALVQEKHPDNLIDYLRSLKVDAYHFNDILVDEETIKELRDAGFFVNIYTVNDKKRRQQLFNMGVNAIFSDYLN